MGWFVCVFLSALTIPLWWPCGCTLSPRIPDCPLRTSLWWAWVAPHTSLGPWLSVSIHLFSLAVHFPGEEPSDFLPGPGGNKPAAHSQAGHGRAGGFSFPPTIDFHFCALAFPCPWHHWGQMVTEWEVDVGVSLLLRFLPSFPVIGYLHTRGLWFPRLSWVLWQNCLDLLPSGLLSWYHPFIHFLGSKMLLTSFSFCYPFSQAPGC